ncbi:hypothetical protein BS17DRAFT_818665 [Gyrodon lividus]|nr:hypothetical protein BS17DRAFT_818665 [Gyrodon lividus]
MHFTLTMLVTLSFFVAAAPQPAKQRGTAIPLSKLSSLVNADQSVNFEVFDSHIASIIAFVLICSTSKFKFCFALIRISNKILRGFDDFKKNIGASHQFAVKGDLIVDGYGDHVREAFIGDSNHTSVYLITQEIALDLTLEVRTHACHDIQRRLHRIGREQLREVNRFGRHPDLTEPRKDLANRVVGVRLESWCLCAHWVRPEFRDKITVLPALFAVCKEFVFVVSVVVGVESGWGLEKPFDLLLRRDGRIRLTTSHSLYPYSQNDRFSESHRPHQRGPLQVVSSFW